MIFSSVEQAVAIKNKLDGTEVFGQEIRVDFVTEAEWGTAEKQNSHLPDKVGVQCLRPRRQIRTARVMEVPKRSPRGFVSTIFRRHARWNTCARHSV